MGYEGVESRDKFLLEPAGRAEKQGGDRHTDPLVPSDPQWPTERKGAGRSHPHRRESTSPAAGPHVPPVLPYGNCLS